MPRAREQRGAAAIEAALCICFIVLPLVFGMIAYGYMLSFRQSLSQSVAEGARAAAVAPDGADREAVAKAAINEALKGLADSHTCASGPLVCTVVTAACPVSGQPTRQCVTATVRYPYRDKPLLPTIPGMGFTLPGELSYTASAAVS